VPEPQPDDTVSVQVQVTTGGTVSVKPTATACATSCRASFNIGTKPTKVTLVARPQSKQYRFVGWTGACAGSGKKCKLILTGHMNAAASFALKPTK
jgi:uncharacterized repeat protein (TIGR02543 family)